MRSALSLSVRHESLGGRFAGLSQSHCPRLSSVFSSINRRECSIQSAREYALVLSRIPSLLLLKYALIRQSGC